MKRLSASSCFTSGDRDLSSVNGSHLGLHRIKDSAHSWLLFQARDVRAVGARLCMRGSHELPITHGELSVTHDTTIYYQSIKKASQAMCQLLTAGITRPVVSINKHVGCKFGAEKASTCHRIGSHGRQGQWNYLAARREAGRSGQGAIEVPTVIDSDHLTTHHQAVRRTRHCGKLSSQHPQQGTRALSNGWWCTSRAKSKPQRSDGAFVPTTAVLCLSSLMLSISCHAL
jgi:hypothetical protein